MLVSQQKPIEEILEMVEGEKNVFLVGCNGCAEVCETGGEKACAELKAKLEDSGISVNGLCNVDFMCNKLLVSLKTSRFKNEIDAADSVVALTCGIGVQSLASVVEKPVHPTDNTVSVGGFQGLWPSEERCGQCGDCVLDLTGGICPITMCSKSLLNGQCGGASNGKCEVDEEKDCGWEKIYKRLESLGKLDNLKKLVKVRDYANMFPNADLRKTMLYDIEQ